MINGQVESLGASSCLSETFVARSHAFAEDEVQLLCFSPKLGSFITTGRFGHGNHPQPKFALARLFAANRHFVAKITHGLSFFCFSIVSAATRASPYYFDRRRGG